MVSLKIRLQIPGHPINIGGLNVQGVMELEDNGIIQGIVLGVKELGSKGVKTIVFVYNGVRGR